VSRGRRGETPRYARISEAAGILLFFKEKEKGKDRVPGIFETRI
jgi:hypothetical protein